MLISKKTLPSVPGGLMNPAFVYTNAQNTDIRRLFAQVPATRDARTAVSLPRFSALNQYIRRGGTPA